MITIKYSQQFLYQHGIAQKQFHLAQKHPIRGGTNYRLIQCCKRVIYQWEAANQLSY